MSQSLLQNIGLLTKTRPMDYAELQCLSNYSFLLGASHPHELIDRAAQLHYRAIALTDECSLAGIVKAHVAAKACNLKLLVGATFSLENNCDLVVLAPNLTAYSELSGFITLARRRSSKGQYQAHFEDMRFRLQHCLVIWRVSKLEQLDQSWVKSLLQGFGQRLWLGVSHQLTGLEAQFFSRLEQWSTEQQVPIVACGAVRMHCKQRKALLDTLTAIKDNRPVQELGRRLASNAESYLKSPSQLQQLYPQQWLDNTMVIADLCGLDLKQLRYQYPQEVVPKTLTPSAYLRQLVQIGIEVRWPGGAPENVQAIVAKELRLIEQLHYEYYFLTVYDIVQFARRRHILCQGRGSAANSVVCYCLFITEVSPEKINVLFERFISLERDEPPDIDVDFEHERREEVIQYIYQKYGRERAALAASVVTYRSRSAIRDVGKALGFEQTLIEHLAQSLSWWNRSAELSRQIEQAGYACEQPMVLRFYQLVEEILGFPRHLSQHVGGFVITQGRLSDLVPLENAAMPERTIIQWDKDDLEAMGLLKIDVLALGMLSAIRKAIDLVHSYQPSIASVADIPEEDPATYDMLCCGDSIGVFQVESRAQMSMLPRLKPRCYYDLVIQIAIVRPGPIQGDMVHSFLRRRDGLEAVSYPSPAIEKVLERTLGVPIFQEQAISLAMVAAGFSGGQADQLRRAMASWGKNGRLLQFQEQFLTGMLNNGYSQDFAERLFEQIKGFGGYGFPESHSASFALLCYLSTWLKCHHPHAFYCGLLNSLPMGFYSAAQLIQDAVRHEVSVLPVDINASAWDSSLEFDAGGNKHLRLGLRRVKGLAQETVRRVLLERHNSPFKSLADCSQRTQLSRGELEILAAGDVFHPLDSNRQQSRWWTAAVEHLSVSLPQAGEDTLVIDGFTENKEMVEDYRALGVSLRAHPMQFLRDQAPFDRCCKSADLRLRHHGSFIRVAGLVTGRQRPGTAKGTVFVTLEDESGNINVVVWKTTQQHFRQALLASKLLLVEGRLEQSHGVIHIIAGKLMDYSAQLQEAVVRSRDFK